MLAMLCVSFMLGMLCVSYNRQDDTLAQISLFGVSKDVVKTIVSHVNKRIKRGVSTMTRNNDRFIRYI